MRTYTKPILRALMYGWLYQSAKWRALQPPPSFSVPAAFIVGCGRSGTTILGKLLADHPQIKYRFEPYHLWAAADKNTDVLGLYSQEPAQLMLDKAHATNLIKRRFWQLFKTTEGQQLIEKTPLNVFRIGYLKALVPHAKFIHIVRDGVDVAHSIGRIATGSPYKIAGKPELNQWWGVADCKWKALKREGAQAGYWSECVSRLKTQPQRGAYEWLTSLKEMARWRDTLGNQSLEIVYEQLVENPQETLCRLCEFLNLEVDNDWLSAAAQAIRPQTTQPVKFLELPPPMAQAFNHYQRQYQFTQRASAEEMAVS